MTESAPSDDRRHALVLIHGWSLGPAHFGPFESALARSLGSEWALAHGRLPGHAGAADDPGWTVDRHADTLLGTLPGGIWIGASLGGQVALSAAMRAPEQVRALVLIGATPRFVAGADWPHGMNETTFRRFRVDCANDPKGTRTRFSALQLHGDADGRRGLRALRRLAPLEPAPTPGGLADGLRVLAETDLRDRLGALACPVLWIAGAADALVPAGAAGVAAGNNPRARVCCLPGAGHAPYLTQPEAVCDAIRDGLLTRALNP